MSRTNSTIEKPPFHGSSNTSNEGKWSHISYDIIKLCNAMVHVGGRNELPWESQHLVAWASFLNLLNPEEIDDLGLLHQET
jgi:hypothetical protein